MLDVNDPEVRRVVQRHLRAMLADLVALAAQRSASPEPLSHDILYDPKTRSWVCGACRVFRDARRRSVTTHARFCHPDQKAKSHVR